MRSRIIWALPLLLLCSLSNKLHAQARFAIYGTVGGETAGGPHESWDLAGTVGFYAGLKELGPLDVSLDARADLSNDLNSGLLGPRVAVKFPAFPIKPYGEFLIGFTDYNKSASFADSTNFAARYVLGTDMTILPHVDWRIADFSYDLNDVRYNTHAKTLSTGLVLRF